MYVAATTAIVKSAGNNSNILVTDDVVDAAKALKTSTYTLSALKMSMVHYNLPIEYSEALRNNFQVVLNTRSH